MFLQCFFFPLYTLFTWFHFLKGKDIILIEKSSRWSESYKCKHYLSLCNHFHQLKICSVIKTKEQRTVPNLQQRLNAEHLPVSTCCPNKKENLYIYIYLYDLIKNVKSYGLATFILQIKASFIVPC